MAGTDAVMQGDVMRSIIRAAPGREADNELYDLACDLVEAAAAIRSSAGRPEAASAVPAVLGCLQEAIHELSQASMALEQTAAEAVQAGEPAGDDRWRRRVIDRMHRGFENLSTALDDAQRASGASRALAARALAVAAGERHRRSAE
jgi:hypothetical protein